MQKFNDADLLLANKNYDEAFELYTNHFKRLKKSSLPAKKYDDLFFFKFNEISSSEPFELRQSSIFKLKIIEFSNLGLENVKDLHKKLKIVKILCQFCNRTSCIFRRDKKFNEALELLKQAEVQ